MQANEQRDIFFKIVLASLKNIIGFGLACALIGYLVLHTNIGSPAKLIAGVVVFIMAITLNTLLMFIVFTVKGMPATMAGKPANLSFFDIYGYTMASFGIRLVEATIYIFYIVYLYRLFFK